jgi:hypothetical protein
MCFVFLCNFSRSLSLSLALSLWLYSPLDLGRFFSFLIVNIVSRTPWTGDQPVTRPLPTHRTTQTQNKRKQTSMPRVGFEPMIPVFERTKTINALDRAAAVIGSIKPYWKQFPFQHIFLRILRGLYFTWLQKFVQIFMQSLHSCCPILIKTEMHRHILIKFLTLRFHEN